MKIDYTKSGMSIWSLSGLFILLVSYMFWYSIKSYNAPNNIPFQLGEYIAYDSGDTRGYIDPIESYISTGEYKAGSIEHKTVGRGPYYGVYYFIFRQFLPIAKAYDAVAVLQILWFALAIIMLMLIVEPYIKYKSLVWLIPLTVGLMQVCFTYLPRILTDPIANSQLICFAYFYSRFNKEGKQWTLWLSALFLAMAAVMKPYLLPIYAIVFFDWAISNRILDKKKLGKYIAIMSVPLIVICAPFTIRNAVKLHIFAPVQNTTYGGYIPDPVSAAMRDMVRVWGEDHTEWGGLGTFFMPCEGITFKGSLPDHIYTKEYDKEDIIKLAEQTRAYNEVDYNSRNDSIAAALVETMTRYRNAYIAEHPLWRVRATWRQLGFMYHHPSCFEPNHRHTGIRHFVSNGISFLSWLSSWILFVCGLLGLLLILLHNKDLRFITLIVLFIALFFSLTLAGDSRYYVICLLYQIVGMVVFLDWIIKKISKYTKHS